VDARNKPRDSSDKPNPDGSSNTAPSEDPSAQSTRKRMERPDTQNDQYTRRLVSKEGVWWKRLLDVQAPYRWNLQRLNLGFTLDIGCGLGRNLLHINGNGVGVDHNQSSVEIARSHGLKAFVTDEFDKSEFNKQDTFDAMLIAHVVEHMTIQEAVALLARYLPLLKPNGTVVLITPQERGFSSDPTHVEFMDFEALRKIHLQVGLEPLREYSFPFPRSAGRFFTYNEFVSLSRRPAN
jgi:2-polyprenyl-3-methyl-5-hydroxy-6-metoxy-1,4-benzoquinol methylase